MSEKDNLSQQAAEKGDRDKGRAKRPWPVLNTPEWVTALGTVAAAIAAIAAVAVSYATYLVASDTGDLKKAVSNISALATQTKRQADNSAAEVRTLGSQFGEMQKQTAAFQTSAAAANGQLQEMRNEQRAIISTAAINPFDMLRFIDGVATIMIEFVVKNDGRSTAEYVQPRVAFYVRTGNDSLERQRATCYHRHDTMPARSGIAVFPGASRTHRLGARMNAQDLAEWRKSSREHLAIPTIVGCVYYESGGKPHHSGFILEVDSADKQPGNGILVYSPIDTTKGDIPASKIIFAENPNQPSLND